MGSLARLPGPPCIYYGSLKGEYWGPQDSKSLRKDAAEEGLEVRRLYLETAVDCSSVINTALLWLLTVRAA